MEVRHLRYFVAIAEERSFTRAAERLWVAQPGLSTQMRRLEAELGAQLFERHTRGVDLTEAGNLFLERACAALAAVGEAAATVRDLESGVVGSLRLGVATETRWQRMPSLLERFTQERGGVELTLVEAYAGTLWRDLRDGRLDVIAVPTGVASFDLRRLHVGEESWAVLVGAGHRLAGSGPLPALELDGERVAATGHRDGAGYDRAVAGLMGELGVTTALVPVGPGPALLHSVAAGHMVALGTAPDALPAGVTARPIDPRRTLKLELLCRDEAASPALNEFLRMVSATVRQARPMRRTVLSAVAA
jgi:DNA-binding transcriptional LysR family regulator